MSFVPAIIAIGSKIIDKFIPDPTAKAKAQMDLIALQQSGELKEMEMQLGDVASARAREMAVKDKVPLILSTFVTFGFFLVLIMVMRGMVDEKSAQIVNIMLGSLGTAWITIISYYFGSSQGSKTKDFHIQQLTDKRHEDQ